MAIRRDEKTVKKGSVKPEGTKPYTLVYHTAQEAKEEGKRVRSIMV